MTRARFGSGISVGGGLAGDFGPVTVLNSTTATANITISAAAPLIDPDVNVLTATESVTLLNGFTVTPAPFTLALTAVSPPQASPLSVVQLTASGFSGSVNSSQVSVTLTPTGGGSAIGPLSVSSAQILPGTILRVSLVSSAAAPTCRQLAVRTL